MLSVEGSESLLFSGCGGTGGVALSEFSGGDTMSEGAGVTGGRGHARDDIGSGRKYGERRVMA